MQRFGRAIVMTSLFVATALMGTAQGQDEGGRQGGGRQGGGRGGFGRGGLGAGFGGAGSLDKLALIRSDQVRTELKVSEEQAKKIDELLTTFNTESRGLFGRGPGRDASEEERAQAREEAAKKRQELSQKTEGELAKILDKDQASRLDQIELQQKGADALVTDGVVASLKLSEEQVGKLKAALKTRDDELAKVRESMRGAFGRGRGGDGGGEGGGANAFQEMQEKVQKLQKDAETACLAVLSKEQGEALAKMKGAAFEIDRSQLRRGGGQGGFGRGGQGGQGGQGGGQRRRPPEDN